MFFYASTLGPDSPVRYGKFESIRYFIDIDILQNCLIDIDIDIFKNDHVDIDIFQIVLIDIDTDIDIFKISLSIFLSISIFSKNSYRYFVDIDILTISVDILSIFQKMPIYRQSISIFHQKSIKKGSNLLRKWIFLPEIIDIDIFKNVLIDIDIDIFKIVLIDIDIDIDIFIIVLIDIDSDIDIFQNGLIDIDIFKNYLIDIDIFKKCRYIDNRYVLSIYRTPLALTLSVLAPLAVCRSTNNGTMEQWIRGLY